MKTYQFLGNHATHAQANDVKLSFFCPTDLIKQFNGIFGHFTRRITQQWFIGLAYSSVVKD